MSINQLDTTLNFINSNEYVTMGIAFALIIFSAYIAPLLPHNIILLFDNPLVKLLIFLVVAYTARKNPTIGIIMAVCLLVVLNTVNQRKIEKMIGDVVNDAKREHMSHPEINNIQELAMRNIQQMQNINGSQNVPSMKIDPQSVQNIQTESKQIPNGKCDQKMKYRDEFYPQYVDLESNAYDARSNLVSNKGYDSTCVDNDSYPQTTTGRNGYLESNVEGEPVAFDGTCGLASV